MIFLGVVVVLSGILVGVPTALILWAIHHAEKLMTTNFDRIKADMDDMRDAATLLGDKIDNLAGIITTLRAQLASGTAITSDQMDALDAEAQATVSGLRKAAASADAISTAAAAAATAPAATAPATEPPATGQDTPGAPTPATP